MEETKYPVLKTTIEDYNSALTLGVVHETLVQMEEAIPERIEAIQGTEKIREIIRELEELKYKIAETFPERKKETLLNQYGRLYYQVNVTKPVLPDKARTVVYTEDLGVLCKAAHSECKLCSNPKNCNRCALGRALDRCMPYDRDKHSSWSEIDLASI